MRSIPPWPLFWPNILKRTPKKFVRVLPAWRNAGPTLTVMNKPWRRSAKTTGCLPRIVTGCEIGLKPLEQIHGHLYEARRVLRKWTDTRGDDLPQSDDLLAQFDPAADLSEQLWKQSGWLVPIAF